MTDVTTMAANTLFHHFSGGWQKKMNVQILNGGSWISGGNSRFETRVDKNQPWKQHSLAAKVPIRRGLTTDILSTGPSAESLLVASSCCLVVCACFCYVDWPPETADRRNPRWMFRLTLANYNAGHALYKIISICLLKMEIFCCFCYFKQLSRLVTNQLDRIAKDETNSYLYLVK